MPLGGGARLYAATNSDNSDHPDPLHARCVSPNPFNSPDPRLEPVHTVYLAEAVPYPLFNARHASLTIDSQTLGNRLVCIQVVRHHRLHAEFVRAVRQPVREGVRIPLDKRFQPQDLPVSRFTPRLETPAKANVDKRPPIEDSPAIRILKIP